MMDIHGITITRDQIYEFDYVLRRFNQLKEEIFGVDYITDLMDSESEVSFQIEAWISLIKDLQSSLYANQASTDGPSKV